MAPYQLPEVLKRYERSEIQLNRKTIKDVLRVTYTYPDVMMQSELVLFTVTSNVRRVCH